MTDLLTQSDQILDASTSGHDLDATTERRKFRASTLDEAVAEARAELGAEVELVEAHRVRRGGLGGFFATDLGVEITAMRRRPADVAGAAGGATGGRVVTGLDRLIEQAGAVDGTDSMAAPAAPSFESQLRVAEQVVSAAPLQEAFVASQAAPLVTADLKAAPVDAATAWPQPASSPATPLVAPTEWFDSPTVVAPSRPAPPAPARQQSTRPAPARPAPAQSVPTVFDDVETPVPDNFEFGTDALETRESIAWATEDITMTVNGTVQQDHHGSMELAPPSGRLNPILNPAVGSMDELDLLLQEVGIDVSTIRVGSAMATQHSSSTSIEDVAMLTTAQLVKSVVALDHVPQNVAQVSVSLTTFDGTSVCVAAQLTGKRHG